MIRRIEAGKRISQAVVHGPLVFLAGQVADDTSADVAGQTREVLEKIDRLLAAAGSQKSSILSATVYLSDMSNYAAMNSSWDAWVSPDHKPARATVESRLAAPEYGVEIVVIAALG